MVYRDPTVTANSFATLNEISEGRAIIGLGTGDGPVYSLGRTATKLSTSRRLGSFRFIARPRRRSAKTRERGASGRSLKAGRRPVPIYISAASKVLRRRSRATA
jgi:alkanesulfonate monooxygenase SsuD/methylene tetrahydromethanopterin reductase-like flavin-dependent oxidoreductase (luciferase family)